MLSNKKKQEVKVIVLPYYAPRKNERTFPPVYASVFNMGRKKVTMHEFGYNKKG